MRPAKRLLIKYSECTERQAQMFKNLAKEYIKTYNRNLKLDDLVMVMTPNPYIIEHRNNEDQKDRLEKHLTDFRKILKLLKITNKEAQEMDLTLNLMTGDKIFDLLRDKERKGGVALDLTRDERHFIYNFKW